MCKQECVCKEECVCMCEQGCVYARVCVQVRKEACVCVCVCVWRRGRSACVRRRSVRVCEDDACVMKGGDEGRGASR